MLKLSSTEDIKKKRKKTKHFSFKHPQNFQNPHNTFHPSHVLIKRPKFKKPLEEAARQQKSFDRTDRTYLLPNFSVLKTEL